MAMPPLARSCPAPPSALDQRCAPAAEYLAKTMSHPPWLVRSLPPTLMVPMKYPAMTMLPLLSTGQVEQGSLPLQTLSPQLTLQSLSFAALQPLGQQPSPLLQEVIAVCVHCALQLLALPVRVSLVHALLSLQLVGQLPSHNS